MKMHLIMMRLGLLVVLLMAHICKGDRVKFTNTNNRQQPLTGITGPANPVNVSTRFFGNYLGYLAALGAAFRPPLIPIQTGTAATIAPAFPTAITSIPGGVASPFPTAPPIIPDTFPTAITSVPSGGASSFPTAPPDEFPTAITSIPSGDASTFPTAITFVPSGDASTFPTAITSVPNGDASPFPTAPPSVFPTAITSIPGASPFPTAPPGASPFPTAPPGGDGFPTALTFLPNRDFSEFPTGQPVSFPTGLVSALGTLLPSQTVSVAQTSFPSGSVAPSDLQCECVATAECPSILRTNPNTRIVTQCPSGQVLCCLAENEITCGIPQVISGVTPAVGQANLGEYPWSAVILTLEDNQFVGGGALIDELHIITVAHRVYTIANPATIKVRLGDWDLSANYEPVRHLERRVTRIVVHPNFDRATLRNDIAILFLSSEVPLLSSQYPQINSVCLPESDDDFTGNRCWTAGWGKDTYTGNYQNIIKEVDLPVISPATCQSVLRQILGNNYVLDPNSFICAGGGANKDSCVGDGGNALTCTINGQSYVAGLTAGGIRCGIEAVPALYVNVPNYVTWINRVIAPALVIEPRRG